MRESLFNFNVRLGDTVEIDINRDIFCTETYHNIDV